MTRLCRMAFLLYNTQRQIAQRGKHFFIRVNTVVNGDYSQ